MTHMSEMQGGRHADMEGLLRTSTPAPDHHFVDSLGRRLFSQPSPDRATRRVRLVPVAASLVASFSAVFVALALLGVGPLSLNGDDSARADRQCRTVHATERVRVPEIQRNLDGRTTLRFPYREVERLVERCSSR
jgi:hypothetical protein